MDGFRYDATRWTGWSLNPKTGAALFAHAAKRVDPTSYQIAEHLPEEAALVNDTDIDAQWDATFRWQLRDILNDAPAPSTTPCASPCPRGLWCMGYGAEVMVHSQCKPY